MKSFFFFILLFFISYFSFGQSDTCANTEPLCSGLSNVKSPGNSGEAETGPYYGCLVDQPNPHWYYIQVATDGYISFQITQYADSNGDGLPDNSIPIDVDFIIYGPFSTPYGNCNNLTPSTVVDCSYSPLGVEQVDIPYAEAGEYYLLLITNWANIDAVFDIESLPSSTGTTNCAILGNTYTECDKDGDGQLLFDLDEIANDISTDPAQTLTFYNTEFDAANDTGLNVVSTPFNIAITDVPNYLFVQVKESGVVVEVIQIILDNGIIPNVLNDEIIKCDTDNDNHEKFDLTSANITSDSNITITYHETLPNAESGTSEIPNPSTYDSNSKTVYARVSSETCYNIAEISLKLSITPIISTPPDILYFCDTGGDGQEAVDITSNENLLIGTQTGVTVSYYESQADANSKNNTITTPGAYNISTGTSTIYIRLENDMNANCYTTDSFDITLSEQPTVTNYSIEQCDDGLNQFILSNFDAAVYTDALPVNITYHNTQTDADNNISPITTFNANIGTNTVYARIANSGSSIDCYNTSTITINIIAQPVVSNVQLTACESHRDGQVTFNLEDANSLIVSSASGLSFSYFTSLSNANSNNSPINNLYTAHSSGEIIYVRVENTNGCYSIVEVELLFSVEIISQTSTITSCDSTDNIINNQAEFNLTSIEPEVLSTLGSVDNITFHISSSEAEGGANPISNPSTYISHTTSVFARGERNNGCQGVLEIPLEVLENPTITNDNVISFCRESNVAVTATGDFDTVEWYLGGNLISTNQTITISQIGIYTLLAYNNNGCSAQKEIEIVYSDAPTITNITVDEQTIIIEATNGLTPYEYSIDGINWQSSNTFTNFTESGVYNAHVRNAAPSYCEGESATFVILNIPNVITPNGDGVNDSWTINGIEFLKGSTIQVFDRYGKEILNKTIEDNGFTWDGKYLGRVLSTADYWFIIKTTQNQEITGHITIKNK